MTRPIKHPPGFKLYRFIGLVTGRSPRKIYLPPGAAGTLNQVLKRYAVDYRFFHTEPKQEAADERSD